MSGTKFQTALQLVFPPRCVSCGDLVESDFGLCGPCWRETPFIGGLVCDLCGAPLPGDEQEGAIVHCDDCLNIQRPWHKGRSALRYDGNARKMVLSLKHGDRHEMVYPLARWLALAASPLVLPGMLVVPVPLHWRRFLKRRFNQSALLANQAAKLLDLDYFPDALTRPGRSGSMDGLSRDERFRKLDQAIRPHRKRGSHLSGRPVLIVDDVMTTGATLAATASAAIDAGAYPVHVLILARVAKAP